MRKPLATIVTLLTLAAAVPLLSACNTVSGAGRDVSAVGHAVSSGAQAAKP